MATANTEPEVVVVRLTPPQRKEIANLLSVVLADSYTLYTKTQGYHWNVEGPLFVSLHQLFEDQYTELALAIDRLAERIRALGHYAPGAASAFARLARVKEANEQPLPGMTMAADLAGDHEAMAASVRAAFAVADRLYDQPSADLLTERMAVHEKTAWMLRAIVKKQP